MKNAVLVLSDPASGSEESLGRLFNALAYAHDSNAAGDEVAIVFAGAGTRWPAELIKLAHPARELYEGVRDLVRGASCGCSEVFGSREGLAAAEVPLLRDNDVPGTPGLASFRGLQADGWNTLIF